MSLQKSPRIESRKYLDWAKGQPCINCGRQDGTVVAAHYQGMRGHDYGRGMSAKAHDFLVAHLCGKCHGEFDNYTQTDGGDYAAKIGHSERFLHLIVKTLEKAIREGAVKIG